MAAPAETVQALVASLGDENVRSALRDALGVPSLPAEPEPPPPPDDPEVTAAHFVEGVEIAGDKSRVICSCGQATKWAKATKTSSAEERVRAEHDAHAGGAS